MERDKMDTLLGDEEQLLLMHYLDGQCGILGRVRARALLGRSHDARRFVEEWERTASLHAEVVRAKLAARHVESGACEHARSSGIWGEVARRIDQERRTAILLGRREIDRSVDESARGPTAWGDIIDRIVWSFGGAAAAATLLLIVAPRFAESGSVGEELASGALLEVGTLGAGEVRRAAFGSGAMGGEAAFQNVADGLGNGRSDRPRMLVSEAPDAVEVDWMRGGGRVRVIPDESERAPIIWVKRNNRALALRSPRASVGVDPRIMSVQSSPGLFDVEEGSLEQPVGGFFGQE